MTTGERVFSVVRGRLYERLPALALGTHTLLLFLGFYQLPAGRRM